MNQAKTCLEGHGRNKEDCWVEPCGRLMIALLTRCWQQFMALHRSISEIARKCYCLIHKFSTNKGGSLKKHGDLLIKDFTPLGYSNWQTLLSTSESLPTLSNGALWLQQEF
jgi:hypothetical protein